MTSSSAGENGTGKEVVANAIHERSNRRSRPLRCLNCGALPGELIERWSSDAFRGYVTALRDLTEAHPHPDTTAFERVLRLEREFWSMTWEG